MKNEFNLHPDYRNEDPMDVTAENYHSKYETVSCPHCGHTIAGFTVMPNHYCYACGGKFGEVELPDDEPEEDPDETSACMEETFDEMSNSEIAKILNS